MFMRTTRTLRNGLRVFASLLFILGGLKSMADLNIPAKRAALKNHIIENYPNQLTNPQKKNRRSLSQFGYNLYLFSVPLYPIYEFISPKDFGKQSYGQPGRKEHNGVLYTCRGGFLDF